MKKVSIASSAFAVAIMTAALPASASKRAESMSPKDAFSGRATVVANFWSCGSGNDAVEASADHGRTSVVQVKQNQCGRPDYPVSQVVYTSQAGFKGTDTLTVVFGRKTFRRDINVK